MRNSEFLNNDFKILLGKFQTGHCNLNELSRLELLFLDATASEKIKIGMLAELTDFEDSDSGNDTDFDRLFKSIQKNISQKRATGRVISLRYHLLRIAAILVLVFGLGGTLSYYIFNENSKQENSYCEVSVPLGSISEIVLPDQSRVWLNAGSKIKYATSFNRKDRLLFLEGEGYFRIAKNNQLPFIVDAFGFEVKAVGTEFNVKAYAGDPTIETTIVEGKVSLQHASENIFEGVFLVPNQRATFFKSKESLTIEAIKELEAKQEEIKYIPENRLIIASNINPKSMISWKENQLIIESKKLSDLVEILARKYNVTFEFKSADIMRFRFSGTLEDETLQQVMDVIKISSPIDYTIAGKTVIIQRNDQRVPAFEKLLKY